MRSVSSLRKPIVLLAAAAGMVALGVSVARVPGAAEGARADLEIAAEAIEDGDQDAATAAIADARGDVDVVQAGLQGPAGMLGQWLPVIGTSVSDARNLGDALEALTSVAELGAEAGPEIAGPDSTFFTDGQVDIPTLRRLIDTASEAEAEVGVARDALDDIEATGPGGTRIGDARDEASERLEPLEEGLATLGPLLSELPGILGAEGERKYLVAILNPAELLYSGGTALSYAPVTVSDGRVEIVEAVDTAANTPMFQPRYWRKVKGNPFHRGRLRPAQGAKAPSWPVAGEETLNAWRSARGRNMSGLIAVDVITLARLSQITGPMDVPGYGRIDSSNLVETLVGSYDDYVEDDSRKTRKQTNRALVPLFMERLLGTGQLVDKAKVLSEAAEGRHFAVYFRDDEVQRKLEGLSITGDLSATKNDYLGVFTQNAIPSKTDYWQSRQVRSDVRLRPDGSARVSLEVEIHNDSAPYVGPEPDPRVGYFTRYAEMSLGTFLPRGVSVNAVAVDGASVDFHVGDYFRRPYVRETLQFAPQQRRLVRLDYDVPAAAVRKDGGLTYRLDIDPQGMVRPQAVTVRVQFPTGFRIESLPAGWRPAGRSAATWVVDALDESPRLALAAKGPARTP